MAHGIWRVVARTLLKTGIAPDRVGNCAIGRRGSSCALPRRAAAAPAWPVECSDRATGNRLPVGRAPVPADRLLTCDVPEVDLSCTSRDGLDDRERSKDPLPVKS